MHAPPTVLVVDDDPIASRSIEEALEPEAYRLRFAPGGVEALSIVPTLCPDLIVCDAMMPGITGFDVCRRIKTHPEWRLVPVMLLTALDGIEDQVRGLGAGADDYMSKPFVAEVLRARARALLRVRGHYRALKTAAADPETLLRARRDKMIAAAGLSEREIEVLNLLLLGRAHDDIAIVLAISERTSRFHQGNILRKFGAESRFDLLRLFA